MGILNVTPDSFSDGGVDATTAAAIARGLRLADDGADIVDVGGESTRPGATPLGETEELERVLPVVAALAAAGAVVSVDTMKPAVARAALTAGAEIINDVGGLRDADMRSVVAEFGCGVVIMHMRGNPLTMQSDTSYDDVVAEVAAYLETQCAAAVAAGIGPDRVCIDPGIGFGKSPAQNLAILDRLEEFFSLGYPVLIGASRKGFLGGILAAAGRETVAAEREPATGATTAAGIIAGAAVIRVHDVASALQVGRTTDAIVRGLFESRESIGRT
jgi:dihydropteroate synthase